MMESTYRERREALRELAAAPDTSVPTLMAAGWNVIGNVLYEQSEDDIRLLDDARALFGRVAATARLREKSPRDYFDAHIALATWSGLMRYTRGNQALSDDTRSSVQGKLGRILSTVRRSGFQMDRYSDVVAQKVCEIAVLHTLYQADEKHDRYALPSPPYTHTFRGMNGNGCTNFHLYAVQDSTDFAPVYVESGLGKKGPHRGVVTLRLGSFMVNAAQRVPSVRTRVNQCGTHLEQKKYMLDMMVSLIKKDASGGRLRPEQLELLDETRRYMGRVVGRFLAASTVHNET